MDNKKESGNLWIYNLIDTTLVSKKLIPHLSKVLCINLISDLWIVWLKKYDPPVLATTLDNGHP